MFKLRHRLLWVVFFLVVILVGVEVTLRKGWGLGTMVLYQEHSAFEYIPVPGQSIVRFGNHISYNEHSMRSHPLSNQDSYIILGFGDSVINGGTLTDQDSLSTTIVEKKLQNDIDKGSRFLNISAGSWGPDNCAAYLENKGSFNAKLIILFVSSHDAHDNMTFEKVVGVHSSYPDKQYPFALWELVDRYILPRLSINNGNNGNSRESNDLMINKNGVGFNTGFDYFNDYTKKNKIPLIVCLHAEKSEVEQGKFNNQGAEIIKYCDDKSIKLISGLDIGEELSDYRDYIHINEKGQKKWANVLLKEIKKIVKAEEKLASQY